MARGNRLHPNVVEAQRPTETHKTKAELADLIGISGSAITNAVAKGRLVLSTEHESFIDLLDPITYEFLRSFVANHNPSRITKAKGDNKTRIRKGLAWARKYLKRYDVGELRKAAKDKPSDTDRKVAQMAKSLESAQKASESAEAHLAYATLPPTPSRTREQPSLPPEDASKIEFEIAKLRADINAKNLKIAEATKQVLMKEMVDVVLGKIGTVITSHFLPMGDRMSSVLAAVFDSADPEKQLEAKKAIDKDVSRSLGAFKQVVQEQYEAAIHELDSSNKE